MPDKKTLTNALKDSMPEVVTDDAKANMIVDAFFATIEEAVDTCTAMTLHGVGEFLVDTEGERKSLVFVPDRVLLETLNEGSIGVGQERT